MIGDGIRRYRNGANRQPPYGRALLDIDEVSTIGRATEDLEALSKALPSASARRDAKIALDAIERLFAADRKARAASSAPRYVR